MSRGYTVLVNSTDSFEDCWKPFFHLFKIYWPKPYPPIVLNTEQKEFATDGLDIKSSRVGRWIPGAQPTWSECLRECLQRVEDDFVLYLQEDYFLKGPVRTGVIDSCLDYMEANGVDCIRLLECGNSGPWLSCEDDRFWEVDRSSTYLVSLQAGLWRRQALMSLIRAHESPWELEIKGSRRAEQSPIDVLCLNRDRFSGDNAVVPYVPTGVVKGRWNRGAVIPLFEDHGITVDYSRRGFHRPGKLGRLLRLRPSKLISKTRSLCRGARESSG